MTTKVILPAGTYRIGDPCYSIPDELWGDFCEILFQHNTIPITEFKGFPLVAFDTVRGDGGYYDENGREYDVDAGLIGAVPVEFPGLKKRESYYYNNAVSLWHEVTFNTEVECYTSHGKIYFGGIAIDTAEDEDFSEEVSYWDDADEEYDLESSWNMESEYLDDDE